MMEQPPDYPISTISADMHLDAHASRPIRQHDVNRAKDVRLEHDARPSGAHALPNIKDEHNGSKSDDNKPSQRSALRPLSAQALYQDLPTSSIRLLKIQPRDSCAAIRCELEIHPLSSEITYTALSYAWGRKCDDCQIVLSGQNVHVRKNLWRYLYHARQVGETGWLWIDALCINQANDHEKMHQVGVMSQIYRNADLVIAWLGPAYENSDVAMIGLASKWRKPAKSMFRSKNVMTAVGMLCMRSYWRRLWILQELVLARRVQLMCGNLLAPWDALRDLLMSIEPDVIEHGRDGVPTITDTRDSRCAWSSGRVIVAISPAMTILSLIHDASKLDRNLFGLIQLTKNLQCADPRDKAYALLGIMRHRKMHTSDNTIADYSVPLPILINAILKGHHLHEKPADWDSVSTQCHDLAQVFGLQEDEVFHCVGASSDLKKFCEEDIACLRLGPADTKVSLWWILFYGHNALLDLFASQFWTKPIDPRSRFIYGENRNGAVCVNLAAKTGSIAALRLLLDVGLPLFLEIFVKPSGRRPGRFEQDLATEIAVQEAAKRGHIEIVLLLLQDNVLEYNLRRMYEYRPGTFGPVNITHLKHHLMTEMLIGAATNGRTELISALRPDKGMIDPEALIGAALGGHSATVNQLLQCGCDARSVLSALPAAAVKGCLDSTRILLQHGANANRAFMPILMHSLKETLYAGFEGESAVYIASRQDHREVIDLLLRHGALLRCSERDDCVRSQEHKPLRQWNAYTVNTYFDLIEQEISSGKISRLQARKYAESALFAAFEARRRDIMELLLRNGVSARARDAKGCCTLFSVCWHEGRSEYAQLLLDHGADYGLIDSDGMRSGH